MLSIGVVAVALAQSKPHAAWARGLPKRIASGFSRDVSVWGSRSINYHKAIVAYLHNKKEVTIW
jgi:hypothetical protein